MKISIIEHVVCLRREKLGKKFNKCVILLTNEFASSFSIDSLIITVVFKNATNAMITSICVIYFSPFRIDFGHFCYFTCVQSFKMFLRRTFEGLL